eukprot:456466-Rhodomonas_salina.2
MMRANGHGADSPRWQSYRVQLSQYPPSWSILGATRSAIARVPSIRTTLPRLASAEYLDSHHGMLHVTPSPFPFRTLIRVMPVIAA